MAKRNQKNTFLALEFGSGSVKLIRLLERGARFQLIKAKSIPISTGQDPNRYEEEAKQAAGKILEGEKLQKRALILAINDAHTCFAQFVLPKIPKTEVAETLKWKMKDEMPFPPEEAFLDYRVYETKELERSETQLTALASALPNHMVEQYTALLPHEYSRHFIPSFVPFSISGLSNELSNSKSELVVVVDLGHQVTEIAFYAEGRLSFLRKISFGGALLTQAMTQPLMTEAGVKALSLEEAQQAQHEENLFSPAGSKQIAGKADSEKLYALIRPECEKLITELKRSMDYYVHEHGVAVSKIFVTGGLVRMKGLLEFLAVNFEVPVKRMDLAQDIQTEDPKIREEIDLYYRLINAAVESGETPAPRPIESLRKAARSLSFIPVLLFLTVFSGALLGGMYWRYSEMLKKTEHLKLEVQNLKVGFETSKQYKTMEQQIDLGKGLIGTILEKEPYWAEVFRELAYAFPEQVILSELSYERNALTIRGSSDETKGEALISKLLFALEGPVFRKATLINSQKEGSVISFTIRCEV